MLLRKRWIGVRNNYSSKWRYGSTNAGCMVVSMVILSVITVKFSPAHGTHERASPGPILPVSRPGELEPFEGVGEKEGGREKLQLGKP
jgi:hypothetical protein